MRHTFLSLLLVVPLWGQDLDVAPAKPVGPPNIESALWELAAPSAAKPTRAADGPRVVVILVPAAGVAVAIDTTTFAALGVDILAQSKSLMRVSVPAAALRAVSELPSVAFVRRPRRPHAQQTYSEGLALIRALENHAAGEKGQGVKVAIIDGGFKGADKLRDDMPVRRWFRDYTGTGIYAGTDAHGTACAEIVHDVAPEAELYLYKVIDIVDLENAKDRCIQNGVAIVNYSATWVGEGFGDGRGLICDIVNDAADNGILWVNAVGNYAQKHYMDFWRDSDDDKRHDFAAGDDMVNFVDEVEIGDTIRVTLTWDDWPTTTADYDLYLYHQDAFGNITEASNSTDVQGEDGGAPVEFIEYFAGRAGTYGISVVRVGEAEPKDLRVWSWHHDIEYPVPASSLGIPSDARGSLSVGAIHRDQWDLGIAASYSSRGPTADGRIKPDLVAPSGVTTASYGADKLFGGTSAAAPHVAGAAALLKSANPSLSRDDLWKALVEATVDVGALGKDDSTGYGKLVLSVSVPQIADVSPRRVQYGQTTTIVGEGFGTGKGTGKVVFFAGKEPSDSDYLAWSDAQIQVRVPTGARTGKVQVITGGGSDSAQVVVTSPYIEAVTNHTRMDAGAKTDDLIQIDGDNFGLARDSGSTWIDSVAVSSFETWSNKTIRFRVPLNAPSGNVTVVTPTGTSNAVRLEIASPYLARLSPPQVQAGEYLRLAGGNFGQERGTGYVLFNPNVQAEADDYAVWSNGVIVVRVPSQARSGGVRVFTADGVTGAAQVEIGSEWIEPLPSSGIFGYSPPAVSKNPKSVKFSFEGINRDVLCQFSTKEINNDEVVIFLNEQRYAVLVAGEDWRTWYLVLDETYLQSGQNVIEFRNVINQDRAISFVRWQLKDVALWKPFSAKLTAGTRLLSKLPDGLGDPFPSPFNAEVTIPFVLAEAGPVRLIVYNLMGQQVRVLADGWLAAGAHRVRWDGRTDMGVEAASGVYWAVLYSGEIVQTAKLALIR
ncbi:MAG: S8 family serine peptidase [Gemmatimonadota bacterium]|nr:S8 family serine peptidase [Gemmatimonadota bacterium]